MTITTNRRVSFEFRNEASTPNRVLSRNWLVATRHAVLIIRRQSHLILRAVKVQHSMGGSGCKASGMVPIRNVSLASRTIHAFNPKASAEADGAG